MREVNQLFSVSVDGVNKVMYATCDKDAPVSIADVEQQFQADTEIINGVKVITLLNTKTVAKKAKKDKKVDAERGPENVQ